MAILVIAKGFMYHKQRLRDEIGGSRQMNHNSIAALQLVYSLTTIYMIMFESAFFHPLQRKHDKSQFQD